MQLKVRKNMLMKYAETIKYQMFGEIRRDGSEADIEWVNLVCMVYEDIAARYEGKKTGKVDAKEVETIHIPDIAIAPMLQMMEHFLLDEARESTSDDMGWMLEMSSIYRQMKSYISSSNDDIREKELDIKQEPFHPGKSFTQTQQCLEDLEEAECMEDEEYYGPIM